MKKQYFTSNLEIIVKLLFKVELRDYSCNRSHFFSLDYYFRSAV
jgi:hypothetical protein